MKTITNILDSDTGFIKQSGTVAGFAGSTSGITFASDAICSWSSHSHSHSC